MQLLGEIRNRGLDTTFHLDRINTCNNSLEAFVEDRFRHDGCRGGSVTSNIAGLAGDFANHASAHVLVDIFEIDFFGDSDAVFRDSWAAETLLKNHVTTLGAKCDFHCAGKLGNAAANRFACFLFECNNLWHDFS